MARAPQIRREVQRDMAKARSYRASQTVERPPAFQEYAAAELGNEDVRLMSAGERGLYWSMRAYCWMNDSIPLDPCMMARALGFTEREVADNLTAKSARLLRAGRGRRQAPSVSCACTSNGATACATPCASRTVAEKVLEHGEKRSFPQSVTYQVPM
jgi:hypothetical protein